MYALPSVLVGQRPEPFWDGVFLACGLAAPGTPQGSGPSPGPGPESSADVEGQEGRMLAAVCRQWPPQEALAIGGLTVEYMLAQECHVLHNFSPAGSATA